MLNIKRKTCNSKKLTIIALPQEFNAYYNVKFGRNPKIVKKMDTSHNKTNGHSQSNVSRKQSGNLPRYVSFLVTSSHVM